MADELIDILDELGNPTSEVRLKSEAHKSGLYHASVHIWFYTKNREILFQKRAKDKDTYPDLWDISVAGHIGTGEPPINSALREIHEEIGLSTVTETDLLFVGRYAAKKQPKQGFFDNEFNYIYVSEFFGTLNSLQLQKEEVSDIKLLPIETFINDLQDIKKRKKYVPHDKEYYDFILKKIINQLN